MKDPKSSQHLKHAEQPHHDSMDHDDLHAHVEKHHPGEMDKGLTPHQDRGELPNAGMNEGFESEGA